MNSIDKVNKVVKSVMNLTDADFEAVEQMIDDQMGYSHPLKHGKQSRLHAAGNHNQKVVEALKNLRSVIQNSGPGKVKK